MTTLHHLDDATLLRYAAGDLDEAFSLIVAAHLAMCEECRHSLRMAEEIGGSLLEETDEVSLESDALDRIFAGIDTAKKIELPRRKRSLPTSDVPLPLQDHIGLELEGVSWKRVAPGVQRHRIPLLTSKNTSLYMLKISPGMAVPEHGHGGSEMTLVLSGAYRDELGRFGPGDIADLDEHVEHQPRVEPGDPCICIVATEAPTRFKGLISRLLQPFVGI